MRHKLVENLQPAASVAIQSQAAELRTKAVVRNFMDAIFVLWKSWKLNWNYQKFVFGNIWDWRASEIFGFATGTEVWCPNLFLEAILYQFPSSIDMTPSNQ